MQQHRPEAKAGDHRRGAHQEQRIEVGLAAQPAPVQARPREVGGGGVRLPLIATVAARMAQAAASDQTAPAAPYSWFAVVTDASGEIAGES